jgi:hypothetical protein
MSILTRAGNVASRVVNTSAAPAVTNALDEYNTWAQASRLHPHAEKLIDGAVQRRSVSV